MRNVNMTIRPRMFINHRNIKGFKVWVINLMSFFSILTAVKEQTCRRGYSPSKNYHPLCPLPSAPHFSNNESVPGIYTHLADF